MAVSYLRSCYVTDCRFYPDRPDVLTKVQWFFVPDETPFLPFTNVFNARIWWQGTNEPAVDLGEVDGAPRQWVDGSIAGVVPVPQFCGQAEAFVNGVPFALRGTKSQTSTGQLECCLGDVDPALAFFMDYPL